MKRRLGAAALFCGLLAQPAAALAANPSSLPTAKGQAVPAIARPLVVMPGMPGPAGSFAIRANGKLTGLAAPATTGALVDTMIGLTDRLGINVRGNFVRTTGLLGGLWNQVTVEGQYALMQTADKGAGLSLVGAVTTPGTLNLAQASPSVGLRALGTMGIAQTNVGAMYVPTAGRIDYGADLVVQATQALAPSIDVLGSVGIMRPGISLGVAPGITFGLTPGIRLGAGYMIPITGSPPLASNLLAHLELGF
ncbi:MAG: hypothetical protein KGR26_06930 [Cyanobacteria bacterium REEB65]|nr:hypothetical protein [Cyanobacteria bacterium REEB65]